MRKNITKSVSNLDLKLLDVKFIAIDDNQIYLTEAMQSVKKSKNYQLPSLLRSSFGNQKSSFLDETKIIDISEINSQYKNRNTLQTNQETQLSILDNINQESSLKNFKDSHFINTQSKSNFAKIYQQKQDENQLQQIKEQILLKKSLKSQNQLNQILQKTQKNTQQLELQKYRRKIEQVKKQNQQIHTQISQLYRKKINHHKEHFKKVKQIQPFKLECLKTQPEDRYSFSLGKQMQNIASQNLRNKKVLESQKLKTKINSTSLAKISMKQKISLSSLKAQTINFYENLGSESPYKQELENAHKKMIGNNFHKNFEQYLVAANKRVPQFIKKLRN